MTQEISMRTIQVEVEKRYKLRPWKKYKAMEQWREIIVNPWKYKDTVLPIGFKWNGSSSPRLAWFVISPWKNPKASGYHDKKCEEAKYWMEAAKLVADENPHLALICKQRARKIRKEADKEYGVLVGNSDGKIMQTIATTSVRFGSAIGAGW
jgi:hypothetical protein